MRLTAKHFLTLLGLILFLSPTYAQKVCIKPETARYYLEQDDRAKNLAKKDSLASKIITNLSTEIILKDEIISSYQRDSITYFQENGLNKEILGYMEDQMKFAKKEIRKQKVQKVIAFVVCGLVILIL